MVVAAQLRAIPCRGPVKRSRTFASATSVLTIVFPSLPVSQILSWYPHRSAALLAAYIQELETQLRRGLCARSSIRGRRSRSEARRQSLRPAQPSEAAKTSVAAQRLSSAIWRREQ